MRTENQALSSARILMLAMICCMVVANIYFNQSVLNLIAATFPHEWAAVSLIPMATQLGYAAGLFLLIPLGDYIERQRLILRQAQVLFLALIGMMLAPTATVLVPDGDGGNRCPTNRAACCLSVESVFTGKNCRHRDERCSRWHSCWPGYRRAYRSVFRLAWRLFVRCGDDIAGAIFHRAHFTFSVVADTRVSLSGGVTFIRRFMEK